MAVQQENSEMADAYKDPLFRDNFWEKTISEKEDIYMILVS